MGKSYRIAAKVGVDKNLTLQVDQDFEQIEILSLKLTQEDIYPRNCADYGVVVGRVFVNNGYGLPNAKVSVFIPITTEDETNPVIDALYPYKTLSDVNEDGYKYNLLPYEPSYSGHTPTGTFPSRTDALINNTAVELFDKYYKFTVTTNDSGDFMIFGVPTGSQTLVMNVDLSDIGEFSLTPQDLIRMGIAVESQFDGNKFKSSNNFTELPQIIVLNKTITVSPFWGQDDVCQVGITRADYDLTAEANVEIMPTSVFMGSIISTSEKDSLKTDCIPENSCGNLCDLVAGPGEILGIRQTIFLDDEGKPVLEIADLPNGGRVVDENGAWLLDLPMNLDYVYTNEFGQKVISNDPTLGIPTKAKYRFKVKWQQSSSLSEGDRRAYFLVPNIREFGWDENFPNTDPLTGALGANAFDLAQKSYAFSLDWSAYTDYNTAVNCEDYFYEFDYNKVYTISQFIDNLKYEAHREKFVAIKRIDDNTCEESVNKFPTNDGVFHTSLMWQIIDFILVIFNFLMPVIVVALHFIIGLWIFIVGLMFVIAGIKLIQAIFYFIGIGILAAGSFGTGLGLLPAAIKVLIEGITFLVLGIVLSLIPPPKGPICLPMLTYPECEACDCAECQGQETNNDAINEIFDSAGVSTSTGVPALVGFNTIVSIQSVIANETQFDAVFGSSPCNFVYTDHFDDIQNLIIGEYPTTDSPLLNPFVPNMSVFYTDDLPIGERINLFNTKGKFFENGGVNKIKVSFNNDLNNTFHYDNTITVVVNSQASTLLGTGTMITFVDPQLSLDPNIDNGPYNPQLQNNQVTGTTTYPTNLSVVWASSPTVNTSTPYILPTPTQTNPLFYNYKSDIEYYQVITALTLSEYFSLSNPNASSQLPGSFADILSGTTDIYGPAGLCGSYQTVGFNYGYLSDYKVVIMQRGVDPYSPKEYPVAFGLGKIFGYPNEDTIQISNSSERYRLNYPVRAGSSNGICYDHANQNVGQTNATINNNQSLYYNSYFFQPGNGYASYDTSLHRYYSSLDSNRLNFKVDSNNNNTLLSSYVTIGTNQSITSNPATNPFGNIFFGSKINSQYQSFESLDGGSFMRVQPDLLIPSTPDLYFSPTYIVTNSTHIISMSDKNKIVMRSDRLPTSSEFDTGGTFNNVFLLQQNNSFTFITETGQQSVQYGFSVPPLGGQGVYTATGNPMFNNVLETFNCKNMQPLDGYTGNGLTFSISGGTQNFTLQTQLQQPNPSIVGGCYSMVKNPLKFIQEDIDNAIEWGYRMRFFYALCSGVLSHVFNNNWINGTLFAYSYRLDTNYDSQNQPNYSFCGRNLVYHNDTNNIYYRSSPYVSGGTNTFIGRKSSNLNYVNQRNLMNPTTIINLGPKTEFLKFVVLNEKFEGYNINKISSTSYGSINDLINFFAVTRITGNVNWGAGISLNLISDLFSRTGQTGSNVVNTQRVDADYAQLASINSELGVVTFDASAYNTGGPKPSAFSLLLNNTPNEFKNIMAVFFSSSTIDMQSRDYVSPVRIIRFNQSTNNFTYDYLNVKSQEVPMYQWGLSIGAPNYIFGSQLNDWRTDISDIYVQRYQSLDRIVNDPYFYGGDLANQYNYRGYIWAVQGGTFFDGNYMYSSSTVNFPTKFIVGAPWYFYFGLRRGRSAINRFYTQYIGEEVI